MGGGRRRVVIGCSIFVTAVVVSLTVGAVVVSFGGGFVVNGDTFRVCLRRTDNHHFHSRRGRGWVGGPEHTCL